MKKYKLINNTLGWLIFLVAAVTYLLTIEPTASFWDCPEFIAQGYKTEIGHPPGNPIFILAANFASKFAGGNVEAVAKCVNAMSAIFSALTILLLFWSITHLVRKLIVKDEDVDKMSLAQYLVVMGSGICGALAYTWSDTFWYSAVEAEVYAFSSFCTALVFWLILKWEDQADQPGSDRWIVLIAYVLGVSLGVHLLNLLCIPAIALIFYYRQCRLKGVNSTVKGSLLSLLVSFVIVGLILYGLEPGFVKMGQKFDLFFVNTLGMSFNSGVLVYAILLIAVLAWTLWELYSNKSVLRIKISFILSILLSGMLLIVDSWILPLILFIALCVYLFHKGMKSVPVRVFTNIIACILVIFIGFSSYAMILIRSSQNTPLDENSPNNTFALAKYLSREQYGETPLLYGRTLYSDIMYQETSNGTMAPAIKNGPMQYAPEVKTSPDQPDRYKELGSKKIYRYSPEQNMLFPRIHDDKHEKEYVEWLGLEGTQVEATTVLDRDGNSTRTEMRLKPTMMENLRFFVDYQLNYMYWRYFLWNFAGRQNDIQGMGEITHGNWISGYSFIDNPRLGDQSLLPDDLGKGNKGHNVFYLLPLLMGIIGLLWQAYRGRRGIEQFWVVFFLFFMTGIAIVLYLNQTPNQPRERDYAYAGSFYAYCIWVGMGVAGLWSLVMWFFKDKKKKAAKGEEKAIVEQKNNGVATAVAAVAAIIGILIPLQMVSQTWDDHDRSGRTAARDFGRNYLSSVAPNGIIFCNGDNDTFPLWYLQEVEGYRTDVRAVNLSYLSTDWYISQMQRAAYESAPLPMQADSQTFAYDNRQFCYFVRPDDTPTEASKSIAHVYSSESQNNPYGITEIHYPKVYIPVDADQAIKAGVVREEQRDMIEPSINIDLQRMGSGMTSSQFMSFDMIVNSIAQGWNRPCYFAMTVPNSYYLGLDPYLHLTGLVYQVTPIANPDISVSTDIMYDNVVNKFLWGGLDTAKPGELYLDETVSRMVTTMRSAMLDLASNLSNEGTMAQAGDLAIPAGMTKEAYVADRYKKAITILDLMLEKLPTSVCPFTVQMGEQVADVYYNVGKASGNNEYVKKAKAILDKEILRYADYLRFYQSLDASKYGRLTNMDKFIDQQYMIYMLNGYSTRYGDDAYQKIMGELQAKGVNMERMRSYQQMLQRAQSYREAPTEDEASINLEEVLGGN